MIYKISELCEITSSKRIFANEYTKNGIPFYRGKEIIELAEGKSISTDLYISQEKFNEIKSKYDTPKYGDILLTAVGTLGIPYFVTNTNFYFKDGNLMWFKNFNNFCISKFFYYYLQSSHFKNIVLTKAIGSTQKAITIDTIKNTKINIPELVNQQHIVNIIGSIDNLIESNTVALNSIESLINNIFHAHYILWKEKKELGKVFTCILGGTPSTKNVEYWDGNIPWINSGEVNNLRISTPTKYITKLGLEKSATKLLPTGTTVIAITGATLGQVSLLEIDSCANQSVIGILENKEYKRDYIYPLMNKIIKELILNQTGGAQQHINKNDVQSFIINIPNIQQYEEYTKIVLPLLNHQSMIVKQNNKLTNLKQKYLNKFFD